MWYTTSTPSAARRTDAASVRSPSTPSTPVAGSGERSKRSRLCGRTSARTSSPRRGQMLRQMSAGEAGGAGHQDVHCGAALLRTVAPVHPAHLCTGAPCAPRQPLVGLRRAPADTTRGCTSRCGHRARGGRQPRALARAARSARASPRQTAPASDRRASRSPASAPACASADWSPRSACPIAGTNRSSAACWCRECAATRADRTPARSRESPSPAAGR